MTERRGARVAGPAAPARAGGPRGYRLPTPVETALPRPGRLYTGLLRTGDVGTDLPRLLVALLAGFLGFLIVVPLVTQGVIAAWWALGPRRRLSWPDFLAKALHFEVPAGMLGAHLGLATLIPVSMLAVTLCGLRPRWLASVLGRVRWGYLGACLAIAFVVLNAVYWLPQITDLPHAAPQAHLFLFLTVIVLTSPLQALAEEVFFRGLLLTAIGGLAESPWVGVFGSSLLFALAHGAQNPWLFLDRFAFGMLAGLLVVATGGLEAGVAAHVVNNLCAFIYATIFSTVAAAYGVKQIGWLDALLDVGGFAVYAALAYLVARRAGLTRRTEAEPRAVTGSV